MRILFFISLDFYVSLIPRCRIYSCISHPSLYQTSIYFKEIKKWCDLYTGLGNLAEYSVLTDFHVKRFCATYTRVNTVYSVVHYYSDL